MSISATIILMLCDMPDMGMSVGVCVCQYCGVYDLAKVGYSRILRNRENIPCR
jgi:hypothetical protein